jgi:hypothetical protein
MSDPLRQHDWDPRIGSVYVAARYAQMRCDGAMGGCAIPPERAPRIIVPPRPFDPALPPRRVWTTLHFCRLHQAEVTAEDILRDRQIRADIERVAKLKWPHGFTADFDNARIEWLLVTTPEYREFLTKIEHGLQAPQGVRLV